MRESGQELFERFVLIRRLGAGGGGEVWLAADRERGRNVALKILDAELAHSAAAVAALERECARVRALDHPNVLKVDAVYRSGGDVCLAMDYAAGGDLSQLRGASALEIVRAAQPIAAALAYAHEAGVVHRDVKATNVLLTSDGRPLLADFGTALADATRPAADSGVGSPYTMSPQQLEGAPANDRDDVYGFGAMLYELLNGYPPFYPYATPERIRNESPGRLPASAPAPLARLIERMLAKSADERPDMQSVERELAALAPTVPRSIMSNERTDATQPSLRIEPPAVRPPAAQSEPLRGEWRRAAAGDRRGRGRGLRPALGGLAIALAVGALGLVFFVLPRLVEQAPSPARVLAAPPEEKANEPAAKPEQIDFAALARAKLEAEERRAAIAERLRTLNERAAERWGGADHQSAVALLAAGDEAYEQREYAAAAEHFGKIEPLVSALEKRAGAALQDQLRAGGRAIDAGRSEEARAAFELAARIDPANKAAEQGLKRAATLDEVLRLVTAAERLEKEGDVAGALGPFRQALSLDAETRRAADGVARIEARLASDAFATAMARGYGALADADYAEARIAFEAARRIRPQASEIAQALRQIDQEQRTGVIAVRLEEAGRFEAEERWADALQAYRSIVELDSTIAAANEGVARTQPRAQLNEQLELYLTQPERLFSQPVRAAARDTLARAKAIENPGELLERQIATLTDWIARADKPVQVAFESDNATHVTIYRIGELGVFAQRSLELAPGSYTVVGTRPGYRDVRRRINVAPGAPLEPIVIRCEDRI